MKRGRSAAALLALALCLPALGQHPEAAREAHSAEYRSIQQKLAWLKQNGAKAHPDPKPVELTEPEVNAYFNEGGVKMPKGVSHLRLSSQGSVIDSHAQVNFEQIMEGRGANNPLYSLFSGTHDVHAKAEGSGVNGIGSIKVQSVDFDGIQIPQFALEWFVQHYLTPKYPNVGITSTFKMPLRIQTATVETGKVRLVQR
jgi:hypothetical protein